jgi:hypothetical protein
MDNINGSMISLREVVTINRRSHILQLMSIQSIQLQNSWLMESHQGDEDDDPIVPPN